MFTLFLRLVGVIQIGLGLAYLLTPGIFLRTMGHSAPAPDLYYPLGMLAARFIAYGIGFFVISKQPRQHILWVGLMGLIQWIDLLVGLFFTSTSIISIDLSAFPMFNAFWIGGICTYWYFQNTRHAEVTTCQ